MTFRDKRPVSDGSQPPVEVIHPAERTTPLIFASPHSGRRYANAFLDRCDVDLLALRKSEDSYMDLLVDMVPELGAPLIKAMFPRAFVDVNRSEYELDPLVIEGKLPPDSETRSNRVLAGFGVIPRLAADGRDIYPRKLSQREVQRRLDDYYHPYHMQLRSLVDDTLSRFGCAIIIDCHSMPSQGGGWARPGGDVDFVLGDRYGASCAPGLLSLTQSLLSEAGYTVARNAPYAGGFVTQQYGRPQDGVHALQIEVNRRLYLDEQTITRTVGFEPLRTILRQVMSELTKIDPAALQTRTAAE